MILVFSHFHPERRPELMDFENIQIGLLRLFDLFVFLFFSENYIKKSCVQIFSKKAKISRCKDLYSAKTSVNNKTRMKGKILTSSYFLDM